MDNILYAIYPGTVNLINGGTRTFTALELATAYGVQDEPYLTVTSDTQLPRDPKQRMRYIELRPRSDNLYQNYKYVAEDDGEETALRPDFDGTKKYIQETDPLNIDPDSDVDFGTHKRDN